MKKLASCLLAAMLFVSFVESCPAQSVRSLVIKDGEPRAMLHFSGTWTEIKPIYIDREIKAYWNEPDINNILFDSTYAETGIFSGELLIEYTNEKVRQEVIKDALETPKSKPYGLPKHYELLRYKKMVYRFNVEKKTVTPSFGCYLDRDGDPLLCQTIENLKKYPAKEVAMQPPLLNVAYKMKKILERIRHDPKTADEIAAFRGAYQKK